jgi:hypothetical protein
MNLEKPSKMGILTLLTDQNVNGPTRARARVEVLTDQTVRSVRTRPNDSVILALDFGTTTGWAMALPDGGIVSGTVSFRPSRYDGGGMRYVRFRAWLDGIADDTRGIAAVHFEEVRRHLSTDAAHVHGGLLATLTAWCEERSIAYQGVPVGTIKRHITGKGNADKAAVIAAVRGRGHSPVDDNEADAIAILLWALQTRGGVR